MVSAVALSIRAEGLALSDLRATAITAPRNSGGSGFGIAKIGRAIIPWLGLAARR